MVQQGLREGEKTEQGVCERRVKGKGLFEGLVDTGGALLSKYPQH